MATNNNLKFEKIVNISIDDFWHEIISYIILRPVWNEILLLERNEIVKNSNEITYFKMRLYKMLVFCESRRMLASLQQEQPYT